MKFLDSYNRFFNSKRGAFSKVTATEYKDSQVTLDTDERAIALDFFGNESIHRGNKSSNPEKALKSFLIYPQGSSADLNLVYPKPDKGELRLYLSSEHGFKPNNGDTWFTFIDRSEQLVIGHMTEEEWDKICMTSKFDDLFDISLEALKLSGGTASIYSIENVVADKLGLSEKGRNQIHNIKEGNRTELGYRLAWARNYLKHAGYIENTQRTIWSLTTEGRTIDKVDKNYIKSLVSENTIRQSIFHSDVEVDVDNEDVELEDSSFKLDIDEPFDPKKVDIISKPLILYSVLKRIKRQEIDLLTGFQRKAGLWDKTKQSRLIESILIRFPLPAFYFDGSNDNKWLVVDGLQRLSSLKNFVHFPSFELENLEFLHQLNGKNFSSLPPDLQRRIEEFEISAYLINPGTPDEVKYNLFKRINTGGLILSSQEIRHALNQGKASDFIAELAECEEFKIATTYSINPDRMLDRDFANRFVAFYINPLESYKPDLDTFLNDSLGKLNHFDDDELKLIKNNFKKAMSFVYRLFEIHSFRKLYAHNERRKPINKALFEVWSVLLAKMEEEDLDLLVSRKQILLSKFMNLMNEDEDFNKAISSGTGGAQQVRNRFSKIQQIILETINNMSS